MSKKVINSDLVPQNLIEVVCKNLGQNPKIREGKMGGKRYQPEQIIGYLREAAVVLAKGSTIDQVCQKIGITEQTF